MYSRFEFNSWWITVVKVLAKSLFPTQVDFPVTVWLTLTLLAANSISVRSYCHP